MSFGSCSLFVLIASIFADNRLIWKYLVVSLLVETEAPGGKRLLLYRLFQISTFVLALY